MIDLKLPKLGEGAESGIVVSILVKEGDPVTKGQTVLELESEKAVAPIPSSESGVVQSIRVKAGDRITSGQVIAVLVAEGAPVPAEPSRPAGETAVQSPASRPGVPAQRLPAGLPLAGPPPPASPSVRKVAEDLGIDLRRVQGSERGGRVVMSDLRAFIQQVLAIADQPASRTSSEAGQGSTATSEPPVAIDFSIWGGIRRQPMSLVRKVIARRMTENASTIPHVTQFEDVDVTRLLELRQKYAAAFGAGGAKLTLTPMILKSLALVLKKHPIFNSSLDENAGDIVFKEYVHLGIAVDTEAGLMVPVLRDADRKSVADIARDLEALARKARERKVTPDEMKGGTFTVSNQGGIGGAHFTPIINKPEAAILGLGRSVAKPVALDGQVVIRTLMPIAISYDHRLIDGGGAARFTVDLVEALVGFDESLLAQP